LQKLQRVASRRIRLFQRKNRLQSYAARRRANFDQLM
jgi:hypothetical protein